jgi:hypothetical protein
MTEPSEDRAHIRRDLAAIVESIESHREPDGVEIVRGRMRFGPSLVGPPGRLHGGLHAYARTLALLERLPSHDPATTYPVRLTLGLYRPLMLEESVAFGGTYRRDERGYELVVDHAENEKLRSIARPASDVDPCLAWFREAYTRVRDREPIRRVEARGVPLEIHEEVFVMRVTDALRNDPAQSLARFALEDGAIDAPVICVALDVIGAATQGYGWYSRIYTARMDLVLTRPSIPTGVELIALSDRRGAVDLEARARPAALSDGTIAPPTKIRVLLPDSSVFEAFAYGTLTLVPAPGELPAGA